MEVVFSKGRLDSQIVELFVCFRYFEADLCEVRGVQCDLF